MIQTFALALPLVAGRITAAPSISRCQAPRRLPLITWPPGTRWHSHHRPFPQRSPTQRKPAGAGHCRRTQHFGLQRAASSGRTSVQCDAPAPRGGRVLETEGKEDLGWGRGDTGPAPWPWALLHTRDRRAGPCSPWGCGGPRRGGGVVGGSKALPGGLGGPRVLTP